ncbi:unnamed protein product [Linum trigynum]|uniref:Zinc knuckle CX2CX4HX4C domain-containing protein n=1 Tax=Linum trigynum TaxID=586398 RepID=A0AAV2F697_9ROSI
MLTFNHPFKRNGVCGDNRGSRLAMDFSIASVGWGVLQIVFSSAADVDRIRKGSPWIFLNFALCLTRWASPTQMLAESLAHAPLRLQLWGLLFECCTERLASMLGAALDPTEPAVIHQYDINDTLFLRVCVVLDLTTPLPYEITTSHKDAGKGDFNAHIKFERLPQLCFLCGVIGHLSQFCSQKAELGDSPPRYC